MKTSQWKSFLALLAGSAVLALSGIAQSSHYDQAVDARARPDASPATPPPRGESLTQDSSPKAAAQADRFTTESTRFKALDTDNDGRLSRAEFTLAPNLEPVEKAAESTERSSASKTPEAARRSAGQNAAGANDSNIGTPTNTAEIFEQLDTDKDGFLSRAELAAESDRKATK